MSDPIITSFQALASAANFALAAWLILRRGQPSARAVGWFFAIYGFTFLSSVLAALGERGASSFVVVAFFGALPLSVALSATYQTPPDAPASYRWSVGHRFWFVLMAVIAFFFAVAAWADPCLPLRGEPWRPVHLRVRPHGPLGLRRLASRARSAGAADHAERHLRAGCRCH